MLKRVVKIIAVVRSSAITKGAANNKDKMFSAEPQNTRNTNSHYNDNLILLCMFVIIEYTCYLSRCRIFDKIYDKIYHLI